MPPPPRTKGRDAQVLGVLHRIAGERGEPAPQLALSELADVCATSIDTVRRSLRRLEDAEHLEVLPQTDPWGGSSPSRYLPRPVTVGEIRGQQPLDLFSDQPSPPAPTAYAGHSVGSRSVEEDHAPAVERCAR